MYILDTDHLSALDRGGIDAQRLLTRLAKVNPNQISATIAIASLTKTKPKRELRREALQLSFGFNVSTCLAMAISSATKNRQEDG